MDYQPMSGVPAESSTNEETVSCYDPVTGSYLTAQPSNYQFPHCQHHPGVPRQHPQAVSVMGVAGQQQVYAQPSCSGSSLSQLLQILKTQNPPHSEVLALLKKNPALMAQVLKLKEQRMQQQQLQQQQQQQQQQIQQQQIQQQQIQQQAVLSVQMQQHPCMGDSNAEMGMGQQHSDMVPHTPSDELVEIMERLGL